MKFDDIEEARKGAYEQGRTDQHTEDAELIARHKQQMMNEAVECEYWDGSLFLNELREKFEGGDKVKVIIIKEK